MKKMAQKIALVALLLCLFSAAVSAAPEKRVALIIGNATYTGISPLKKPVNDAQRMAGVLRGMKFEVILGTDCRKDRTSDHRQPSNARNHN
jgi:hypothetical protein